MSVRITPYKRGGWEVDIRVRLPTGEKFRRKYKSPVGSKTAARWWGKSENAISPSTAPTSTERRYPL